MLFTTPSANASFSISAAPAWPNVVFTTDQTGPHTWQWTIRWRTYSKTGAATTAGNVWDAQQSITDLGGILSVRATAANQVAAIDVKIAGTNPSQVDVTSMISASAGSGGFDDLVRKESSYRQFGANGEPLRSFDGGTGLCQLTNPTPTFSQSWNWRSNITAGLALLAQKRNAAIAYLGASGRSYTPDQLTYETICRWNGGAYHVWDTTNGAWVRDPNIVCDSRTGNIGWDLRDPANAGQTEAALRARDSGAYSHRPRGAHWDYYGVCYADDVL
jgi:hypothetical protein